MKLNNKDAASQYIDLVNQPGLMDNMGDAFIEQGRSQALNGNQKMQNAMMSGFGYGMKGGANSAKQQKLAWLEDQNKQLAILETNLQISLGKSKNLAAKKQEFADNYTPLVATFAEAVNNNDPRAEPMFNDLISKASQTIPGMEGLVGYRWDPVKGEGWLLNSKTKQYSKISADEIISIIAPSAKAIYGDKWFEKFIPLNGGFAKDAQYAHNVNRQATELELQSKQADISNKNSQANLHNTQADKTNYEMNNPEKPYNKEVASHNLGYIKEQRERKINAEALVATLNDLEGFIKEADEKGQAGSDIRAIANRAQAKYWSGDNEKATLADMAKAAYFARVKEGGGSNPSTTEFLTVLETVPNIDKNPKAALKRLEFDREQALKQMYRFKKTEQGLRESQYQGSPDDESVFKHDDDEYKSFSSKYYQPKQVKVQAPDGTVMAIPKDKAEEAVKRGGVIIE